MIRSINATLNTGKKKVLALVLSCGLVLALGSGIAYAASDNYANFEKGLTLFREWGDGNESISVKDEDGVRSYSTDGGRTWSQTPPEGLVEEPVEDIALPGGESVGVRVNEDGTLNYSTDGGKTWSADVPEGFSISVDKNGNSVSGKLELAN